MTGNLFKMSKQKESEISTLIARFIGMDMRPYRTVECEGFKQLIQGLAPNYTLPARTPFSRRFIPIIY